VSRVITLREFSRKISLSNAVREYVRANSPTGLYYLMPYRLSSDSKIHDLEWPFYIKFSLLRTVPVMFIITVIFMQQFLNNDYVVIIVINKTQTQLSTSELKTAECRLNSRQQA